MERDRNHLDAALSASREELTKYERDALDAAAKAATAEAEAKARCHLLLLQ
jgi:hypothetical protein